MIWWTKNCNCKLLVIRRNGLDWAIARWDRSSSIDSNNYSYFIDPIVESAEYTTEEPAMTAWWVSTGRASSGRKKN